ncbi:hypothetical protein LOCC1_G004930 [Lachnellula occidentalis]|uniref:Uncharacterized protein n=1 Tax=Lachnellula occidentalis TaxID=215460 RepID=A0A8H8UHD8_9HELO|nr:hypothetical protein LOCC1_G004930 [Lachnellula occidentalis]
MGNHVAVLICGLMSLIALVCSQSFPYNPTTILLAQSSSDNKDIAYAFLPISQSNTLHQLVSLNISWSVSQSNLSLKTITPKLPFTSDDSVAFIPSISSIGEISVYTGACSTSESSALWRFTPSNTSTAGNGTWAQQTTNTAGDVTSDVLPGADYLSSGLSFSTLVHANASQTKLYIFGGMCPTSEATISTWQSASNYSNNMLRLAPTTSSSDTVYTLDLPSSRGPPIAEAGFTITGLTPTYSNGSDVITQQQNFVLLGGHTQSAFINMSQVAVWSLPEESWSFVTVDAPTVNGNTELTVKSTVTDVDSRSGHTAVLTEEGSKIIVLGGWVGDINQAAEPQLAILDLGTGFGGTGDWKWTVPNEQPSGTGMYGHGAVMLPGNVMMILGGYNVTTTTSKRAVSSTQAMFFNATSLTWSPDYTNPAYVAEIADRVSKSSSNSANRKLGLGLGLGLGLAAILIAYGIFLWYSRRLAKKREEREKVLVSGSGEPSFSHSHGRVTTERGGFPWAYGGWNGGDRSPNEPSYDSNSAVAGYENMHNGVHALGDGSSVPIPPRQIPRKPLHSHHGKGVYQPMGFDFNSGGNHVRANSLGTAGPIHPIYEADEDDNGGPSGVGAEGVGVALGDPSAPGPSENRHSDPFRDQVPRIVLPLFRQDSTMGHSPELESPTLAREREVQEWVTDWAAADALLNAQTRTHSHLGRVSPTRRAQLIVGSTVSSMSGEEDSGRTASNLSERSVAVSAMSGGSSSRSRSNSLRGFITNAMSPFSGTILSAASTTMSPVFDGLGPHDARSFRPPGSAGSGSGSTSTFNTAHTSFATLQAEGESLLPRPDDMYGREHSPTRSIPEAPGSPSKSKLPARNRGQAGWLGSIRRVFAGDQGGGIASSTSPNFPTREASPVREDHGSGVQPRRTVSAGATLWRRKQGKGDWKDSEDHPGMGRRSNTFTGDYQGNESSMLRPSHSPYNEDEDEDDDEDWDIERAVENRVVQVMFTVPKEKLRVVNHDVNDDRSEVGSLRSKKGSAKSLKDVVMPPPLVEGDESSPPVPTHRQESPKGSPKGKGKVSEIVEDLERRNSPER